MTGDKKPEKIVPFSVDKYHADPEINRLIDVGVRLGTKYIQHIRQIQRFNMAEARLKEVIKAEKKAHGPEAVKLRKEKMRLSKFVAHARQQNTPDFGTETSAFVQAVARWIPPMPEVTLDDI